MESIGSGISRQPQTDTMKRQQQKDIWKTGRKRYQNKIYPSKNGEQIDHAWLVIPLSEEILWRISMTFRKNPLTRESWDAQHPASSTSSSELTLSSSLILTNGALLMLKHSKHWRDRKAGYRVRPTRLTHRVQNRSWSTLECLKVTQVHDTTRTHNMGGDLRCWWYFMHEIVCRTIYSNR